MTKELPFDPFPLLRGPHHQAIVNSLFNFLFEPASDQLIVPLSDGDKISLEITTPRDWKESNLTVFLVHGLCGSHKSSNLVRLARRLEPLGIRTVRFNMRGCGSGKGLAKQIYHSGRSEDIFASIKAVKRMAPESPIVLIGFSLGGNLVLKMAGELDCLAPSFIQKVIAVSPPVDLYSSILMLGDSANAMYEKYFYRLLRANVHYLHKKFKDLPPIELPRSLKLYEFDQIYTAPTCGFQSADDYYSRCSSAQFIPNITVPCTILFAEDDPIVSSHSLDQLSPPPNVEIVKTKNGGHMGYLGDPRHSRGFYWLDSVLLDWIQD